MLPKAMTELLGRGKIIFPIIANEFAINAARMSELTRIRTTAVATYSDPHQVGLFIS